MSEERAMEIAGSCEVDFTSGPNTALSSSLSLTSNGTSSERDDASSKSMLKPSGSWKVASVAVDQECRGD